MVLQARDRGSSASWSSKSGHNAARPQIEKCSVQIGRLGEDRARDLAALSARTSLEARSRGGPSGMFVHRTAPAYDKLAHTR